MRPNFTACFDVAQDAVSSYPCGQQTMLLQAYASRWSVYYVFSILYGSGGVKKILLEVVASSLRILTSRRRGPCRWRKNMAILTVDQCHCPRYT